MKLKLQVRYPSQEERAREREAKEQEAATLEFEKWKGDFSVEEEGTVENESGDGSQNLLANFVDYIKAFRYPFSNSSLHCFFLRRNTNAYLWKILLQSSS